MIDVGNSLTRLLGSLFILGAAIGAGTVGVAAFSSAAAGAVAIINVNDAGDPASPLPPSNCVADPEGDCTLRAALGSANTLNQAVTIDLPDPTTVAHSRSSSYSVNPAVGELQVTDTAGVTVLGAGASVVDIRAGCPVGCTNDTRVLEIGSGSMGGAVADISGVTISNGSPPVSGEWGDCGGICVSDPGSNLTLTNSTVTGNTAITAGGGIELYNGASATLTNDTITENTVSGAFNTDPMYPDYGGGGIAVYNVGNSTANLTIRNTTISGNNVAFANGNSNGGGIDVFNTAGAGVDDANLAIDIDSSTISDNQAYDGAGLALSDGTTTLTNVTISGNTATGGGGGIASDAAVTDAAFDTIVDNTAANANSGGNLDLRSAGTLHLGESIVAGGVSNGAASNCVIAGGTLHSSGYNLTDDASCGAPSQGDIVGESPQLGGLANNGGPTQTQLPAPTSPAVSAVPSAVASTTGVGTDQRGESRGQGLSGFSTVGSVEVAQAPTPPTPPAPSHGYWLVGGDGGIFTFGSSQFYGSTGNLVLQRPVTGIAPTSDRAGYWMVASDGGVFAYGDAGFVGSIPGLGLHPAGSGAPNSLGAPIVGLVPSRDGGGYFMVAADGGVFAFGDARFAGSCPGIGGCRGSAVAVMPDASGNGYWIVTDSGNVYGFGDAAYQGAPGHGTVTSAMATPDGLGYWILLSNGRVFAYGDATDLGSAPATAFNALDPANAIFATADGTGYWVSSAAGAVYAFGQAPNDGSMAGTRLNSPIIAGNGF
jgi:predicted outer membrane repeat protein